MKVSFLLLLFIIITVSISLITLRKRMIVEKFTTTTTFSNTGCTYIDKFERRTGNGLNDCVTPQPCKTDFEKNHDCIKNNFIDKRCKLIKIWYATKDAPSAGNYTFLTKNSHVLQMNRDSNLNCQQFGENDSNLKNYLNSIRKEFIKDNTESFEKEEDILHASKDTTNNNTIDKLIIGYAYASSDEDTSDLTFDAMNLCVTFDSKFYDENGAFKKEFLTDDYAKKTFYEDPKITEDKRLKTGIMNLDRYIKKRTDNTLTIVYGTQEKSTNDIPTFSSKKQLTCNNLVKDEPNLWIQHTDNKYRRVNFVEPIVDGKTTCQLIENPNGEGTIDTYKNTKVKTESELISNNYVPTDGSNNVFEIGYDFSDETKWFLIKESTNVFGEKRKTIEEKTITVCDESQYEAHPPSTQDAKDKNFNDIKMNISDRTCEPLTQCQSGQYIESQPEKKNVTLIVDNKRQSVDMNKNDRKCEKIQLGENTTPENSYITNFSNVDMGNNDNVFSGPFEFESLRNCTVNEYVSNITDFENSKRTIYIDGTTPYTFHTIDRVCTQLTPCEEDQYASNADHFTFNGNNNNHIHSNLECTYLNECSTNQYLQTTDLNKLSKRIQGMDIYAENYTCNALKTCAEDEYISNMSDLENGKYKDMYTSDVKCTALKTCTENQFQEKEPTATSDRVCKDKNPCNTPLEISIPLDKSAINIPQDSPLEFTSQSTSKICAFNSAYFTTKNPDLDFFRCSRILLKYSIVEDPTPNNDILKHSPRFIFKKKGKEIIFIMKLDTTNMTEIEHDTSTNGGIFNTFNKYPNDEFELYFDTGSFTRIKLNLTEFTFFCTRNQQIHVPSNGFEDNKCKYEHKDNIPTCLHSQYYHLKSGIYECKDYEPNDCKISDKKVSCAIDTLKYTSDNLTPSYKLLYNDNMIVNNCQTECDTRTGCGAFKINPLTNICELYGFETAKIKISNIDINKFNIKYNTDDTSDSEVSITSETTNFQIPVHITQLSIEPTNNSSKVSDLPNEAYIRFYYYDNTYKTYAKNPNPLNNDVDIESYIRTDALLEIQDIYYIPDNV